MVMSSLVVVMMEQGRGPKSLTHMKMKNWPKALATQKVAIWGKAASYLFFPLFF